MYMAHKSQLGFHGHKCRGIIYLLCFFFMKMKHCVKHLLQLTLSKYYSGNNTLLDTVNSLKMLKEQNRMFWSPYTHNYFQYITI